MILGEEVLPHHTLHSTSTICEVKFGKDKVMIVHYKYENVQDRRRAPKVVNLERNEESELSYAERIVSYVNPEDTRETGETERVEIFWPHDLLKVHNYTFLLFDRSVHNVAIFFNFLKLSFVFCSKELLLWTVQVLVNQIKWTKF